MERTPKGQSEKTDRASSVDATLMVTCKLSDHTSRFLRTIHRTIINTFAYYVNCGGGKDVDSSRMRGPLPVIRILYVAIVQCTLVSGVPGRVNAEGVLERGMSFALDAKAVIPFADAAKVTGRFPRN